MLGAGVVVAILLIVGIKACQDSAHTNSLREYDRNVASLLDDSQSQVARPLFALLRGARSRSPIRVATSLNSLRTEAERETGRARELSAPDELADAQRDLVLSLGLRSGAMTKIADKIRTALASADANAARAQIAGQMQAFLASDVLVSQRVFPLVDQALLDRQLRASTTPSARFLPDLGWLNPEVLGARLDSQGGSARGGPVKPGRHGHQLSSVAVGGTTLQAGATNTIAAAGTPTFTVSFLNQGTNVENGVVVEVRVTGAGAPIIAQQKVPKTTPGQQATASVALPQAPPAGRPVSITVTVQPVPGEQTTSNNTQTYSAVFR